MNNNIDEILKKDFGFEESAYKNALYGILEKLYNTAFNEGFKEGYIKGFSQAKETYKKDGGAADEKQQ